MRRHKLIDPWAQKLMEQQDAERAKAREGATADKFAKNFISTHASQIEMIRRGAVVTETVADRKRSLGLPIEYGDESRPLTFAMPDKKPVPTRTQARLTIWLSRISRPFRRFGRWIRKVLGTR